MSRQGGSDGGREERVWALLTRDFYWDLPDELGIDVYGSSSETDNRHHFQVFEVAVTLLFKNLRPEYSWFVTPNASDGGVDFVGEHTFLHDDVLGISASLTVGGQCKKRGRVDHVLDEVASDVVKMIMRIDPTFIVIALSARLDQGRVDRATEALNRTHGRHCHVLDREQLEGLFAEHLDAVVRVAREALSNEELDDVVSYLRDRRGREPLANHEVICTPRVLAGEPFRVSVAFDSPSPDGQMVVRWRPPSSGASVSLVGPIGAETDEGVTVRMVRSDEGPLRTTVAVELQCFAVGDVDLGALDLRSDATGSEHPEWSTVELDSITSTENLRPRFFERPVRPVLDALGTAFDRCRTTGVEVVAIVGGGGSGKSRACEEFSAERRRRGSRAVVAQQTKSENDTHRLIADALVGLTHDVDRPTSPEQVVASIARYDVQLAERSSPVIHAVLGSTGGSPVEESEQSLVSALLVLLAATSQVEPVILHLQDLHWASASSLRLIDRMLWQLQRVALRGAGNPLGILVVLEGRIGESNVTDTYAPWSTQNFEEFVDAIGATTVVCEPLRPDDAHDFVLRLFEDRQSAQRIIDDELFDDQAAVVEEVRRASGANPFHSLEHIRILRQRGHVAQNPLTGLYYLVRPTGGDHELPQSVRGSIESRWRYQRDLGNGVALLLWAVASSGGDVPAAMFRHLWQRIAPSATPLDITRSEMLDPPVPDQRVVTLRHENYVRALRSFEVGADERRQVVAAHETWFESLADPTPMDGFRWALVLLDSDPARSERAIALLRDARHRATAAGDTPLAQRIGIVAADASWRASDDRPIDVTWLLALVDDEAELIRELQNVDVRQALDRVVRLRARIDDQIEHRPGAPEDEIEQLRFRAILTATLEAQTRFNNQQPAAAKVIAERCVDDVRRMRLAGVGSIEPSRWDELEMECVQAYAVSTGISGEPDRAREISASAAAIARRLRSKRADHVVGSYGTLLSAIDPTAAIALLRERLGSMSDTTPANDAWNRLNIFLAMAMMREEPDAPEHEAAESLLLRVFDRCDRIGHHPDAAAAGLNLGILALRRDVSDAARWFGRAVSSAARGRQLETLWRAHFDLATSLVASGRDSAAAQEHAAATVELLSTSLDALSDAQRSPRFVFVRPALTCATSYLLRGGDRRGRDALRRFRSLEHDFVDLDGGTLVDGWTPTDHYQIVESDGRVYYTY